MFFKRTPKYDQKNLESDLARTVLMSLPFDFFGMIDPNHSIVSTNLSTLIGTTNIRSIIDILSALHPDSAAQIETLWHGLSTHGTPFSCRIHTRKDHRPLTANGNISRAGETTQYPIIWFQDHADAAQNDSAQSDLERLQTQFETLCASLDTLSDPVWVADALNNVAWCNDAYTKIVGQPKETILNGQLLPEMNKAGNDGAAGILPIKPTLSDVRKTKTAATLHGRRIVSGQRRLYDIALTPAQNGSDLIVCTMHDATPIVDLKKELTRLSDGQTRLLETLQTAVAIFGADQKLSFYNQPFARLWGIDDAYLNTHPKLGDFLEKLRELRRLPEQSDFRAYKRNWLDWFTTLLHPHEEMLYLPSGAAIRLVAAPHPLGGLMFLFEDVTSNLALETSYNTLMAIQRETLDALNEGVAVFGADGRLRLFNKALSSTLNLPPERLEGSPHMNELRTQCSKHFTGRPNEDVGLRLQSMVLERTEETIDIRDTGGTKQYTATSTALPDGGTMLTWRDVTDRTIVEQALRERADALEEAEKLKSDFLANVSYQFRTPLNAMTGFTEALHRELFGPLTDRQKSYTQTILEAGGQLATLIDDILDLTSLEAGKLALHYTDFNVNNMLHNVYNLMHDWAGHRRVHMHLKAEAELDMLNCDEKRVKQILLTIVRQSLERCAPGCNVTLLAKSCPQSVCMTIEDDGHPLDPAMLERLFSPFETVGEQGGSLGLSLVKSLIDALGGTLKVESTNKKTTFNLMLPRQPVAGDR